MKPEKPFTPMKSKAKSIAFSHDFQPDIHFSSGKSVQSRTIQQPHGNAIPPPTTQISSGNMINAWSSLSKSGNDSTKELIAEAEQIEKKALK